MKIGLLTLVLSLMSVTLSAQSNVSDNLQHLHQAINSAGNSDEQIAHTIAFAIALPPQQVDSVLAIRETLPSIATSYKGIPIATVQDYFTGIYYHKRRRLDSLYHYFNKVAPEFKGRDTRSYLWALNHIAVYHARTGANDSAIYYLKISEPLALREEPTTLKRIYGNLGIFYRKAKNYDKALEYFDRVFALPDANRMDSVIAYMQLGSIMVQLERYPEGKSHFMSAYQIAPNNSQFQVAALNNVASILRSTDAKDSALSYYNQAYDIITRAPDARQLIIKNRLMAADIYLDNGELTAARQSIQIAEDSPLRTSPMENKHLAYLWSRYHYEKHQYDSVIHYAKGFLADAENLISSNREIDFGGYFELIISTYEHLGDQQGVNTTYAAYVGHLKNNDLAQAKRELTDLKIAYETQEKEEALQASRDQLAANQKINWLLGASFVMALFALLTLAYTFTSVRNKNQQLEAQNQKIKILIRELHHRVKNNLQVISSLLGLQSLKLEGEEAKAAFAEGKSRVNAMAMIHKKLYQQEGLEQVNIHDYLEELVRNLKQSFDSESKVKVNMDVAEAQFNMDKAIPVGLILNELITNSFKYAFDNIEQPLVEVRLLQTDKQFQLDVMDNGIELDQNFDVNNASSFGLRLVHLLVDQLGGSIRLHQANHTKTFSIEFS
ncbi:tetratricopeptide repeat-containing sensor histidine kinase [Marinoscillum furvescens]|uniref:histidine kinase n=1 Tax=Marinoscillum furvescens DSM 4134 TaxID=1122208 RepID=A0A3D9L760_MARFU|nr:histidine kinase dimerization/phosphoacceptor domain -containing protein [Marinoscillum furvescens]REE02201.1 two-component sensor histidine kinase [Marinoscillum furvescens DSM 4134]